MAAGPGNAKDMAWFGTGGVTGSGGGATVAGVGLGVGNTKGAAWSGLGDTTGVGLGVGNTGWPGLGDTTGVGLGVGNAGWPGLGDTTGVRLGAGAASWSGDTTGAASGTEGSTSKGAGWVEAKAAAATDGAGCPGDIKSMVVFLNRHAFTSSAVGAKTCVFGDMLPQAKNPSKFPQPNQAVEDLPEHPAGTVLDLQVGYPQSP